MFRSVPMVLLLSSLSLSCVAGVLVPQNSTWRYLKGYSEASSPDPTAWREPGFSDASWALGQAAFYYENQPGTSGAYTGNTALSDMYGGYTCVFLRKTFAVTNIYDFSTLQMAGWSDDGFIAWLNGREVARFNMPSGDVPYNGLSSPALAEPIPWFTNTVSDAGNYLVPGTNVLCVQAFNCALSGSSDFIINPALYFTSELSAPTLALIYPQAGTMVRQLSSIEVAFSKPVAGIDAGDLLINGQPATNLSVVSPSQFIFQFPEPPTGSVQVSWAPGNDIRDLSSASNAFVGGSWSYTLDPNAPLPGVIISEFMAANSGDQTNSLHDELGNSPDWIELYNSSSDPVSLTGWSLTDDSDKPRKWVFPGTLLPARSYLVVFASGRNTNVAGQFHTSFKLSSSPAYLALVDAAGNVVSDFSPAYPLQYTDVSFGRDRLDPSLLGYFASSTPGAPNATRGDDFAPEVKYTRASGTFTEDFLLTLSTADTDCDIRYVLVSTNLAYGTPAITNIPAAASALYTGPLLISNTVQVRARSFPRQPGRWPGPPTTASYIKLTGTAPAFTSELPVLLLHNLGGGGLSASSPAQNQSVVVMVFEPVNGRTSLTNPPTLVTRGGFNIRGSSTAGYPQYNLALELWDEYNQDTKLSVLGMPAESDWVLYAQDDFDRSYLHNPLAHQLSRDVGRYSSRTRFAEVFLNTGGGAITYSSPIGGNYFGLYTVEEKIKRGNDRVNIEKLEPQFTTAPGITGGYLLKIDRADPEERTFYDPYLQGNIVFQDPPGVEMVASSRQAQYNYITGFFSQFGAALWGSSYTNPLTGYAAYIDVDSWIDHHLLNALAFNVDAFRLSGYFYKDRNKKIEMGPLWDFDRSMGTSGDNRCFNPRMWRLQSTDDQGTDFFGNPNLLGVRWWQRLFIDPDFWQRWIDRWAELRGGALSTNHLFEVVDALSGQLKQAQQREAWRWNYTAPRSGYTAANGYAYSFPGTYPGEIKFLKTWIADRVDFIDTNFLRAPVFSAGGGPITAGFTLTISAPTREAGTTIYYTLDGTDPRLPGGRVSPKALSGTGPLTLTLNENARVFARNWNLNHANVTNWPGSIGGNPPISSPWSAPRAATFIVATPTLAITEIMYHPAPGGTNNAGDFEFVELKNVGTQPVNLVGVRFTNGIDFTFTATNPITSLAAGDYLVLVKNQAAFAARYPGVTNVAGQYTGSLGNAGERLCLEGALREPILDFSFNDSWYPTTDGQGFSLVIRNEYAPADTWTNSASWRASSALNGSPGQPDQAAPVIPAVLINELLTHTDPPQVDTVELYNPTADPVPVGGWFLTDDHLQPKKFRIPDSVVIPAGGYALLDETQFNSGASNSFAFSSLGEEVYVFSGDGINLTGYRHGFQFGAQLNGATFGRYVTSDGLEHFVTEKANTLGSLNAGPVIGPVVINEIMFSPPPFGLNADTRDEYVELRNITSQPAPLFDPVHPTNAWRLDGAVQFTFPAGVTLPASGYALIVGFDPDYDPVMLNWFRTRYGVLADTAIFGPWQGRLANEGERLGLYLPDKPEIAPSPIAGFVPYVLAEEVHYSNRAPWPTNTDGTGRSLQRIDAVVFSDDPASWQAGLPSPGGVNWVDTDNDGLPDPWEVANGLDNHSAQGADGPTGDPDGDGLSNWQEYLAGTSPTNSVDFLRFDSVSISGDACALQFTRHAGRVYTVEVLGPFGSTNEWSTLYPNITGNGPFTIYDPVRDAGRYYRLRVSFNPGG